MIRSALTKMHFYFLKFTHRLLPPLTELFADRFMIDDHNVPSLSEMLRFADNVRNWLSRDPENVIVVHCKGETLLVPALSVLH